MTYECSVGLKGAKVDTMTIVAEDALIAACISQQAL